MAKKKPTDIANIALADLTYAVNRLIAQGQTTAAEVQQLAAERTERIAELETELAALKRGGAAVAKPAGTPKGAKGKAKKAGKTITRKDGRTFTTTKKVIEARRIQGRYLGYLRPLPDKAKARIKALAKKEGVPAAVEAMEQMRGVTKKPTKKASKKKVVTRVAKKVAKKTRAPRATSAARARIVAEVEKVVKASKGVSLSDVVAATGLNKNRAAAAIRTLKHAGKIHQAGDRRFARYAGNKKTAALASKAARKVK